MKTRFEWDPAKARSNLKKHGVSFELAVRVFADPFALTKQDRIENGERRWRTVGLADDCLLVVAHAVLDDENGAEPVIRIISARRAEPKERKHYEQDCSPYA